MRRDAMVKENDLKSIVDYMKEKGIFFSSDHTDVVQSNAYAIMGGKTSVRVLQDAHDGINGICLFCYRNKDDLNNILEKYCEKVVYTNGEKTRPYKIRISYDELDEIIEILKKNAQNVK